MIEKTDNNKPIFFEEFNLNESLSIKKEDIVNQIKERLGSNAIPIQIPNKHFLMKTAK